MALQKHNDRWWSDIVRTEIRLTSKGPRRLCILPPCLMGIRPDRAAVLKRITGILSKARALLARQPPAMSTVVRADPAEAYLHACLAAPLFYVSPATYGLADNVTTDEKASSARPHCRDESSRPVVTSGKRHLFAENISCGHGAYLAAICFDLNRPSWAVATVYIVAHPLSGAISSKSAYRLLAQSSAVVQRSSWSRIL